MKLRTSLCVLTLGIAMLACGGGGSSSIGGGSSLNAPWDSMGLPNDQTSVLVQTDSSITMDVPGEPATVGPAYEKAITGNGWSTTAALTMMGDTGGGVYGKDGKTLSLAISKSFTGDGTSVSIAIN